MAKNFLIFFCSKTIDILEFDCVTNFALLFVVSSWIRYIHRNLWKTGKKGFVNEQTLILGMKMSVLHVLGSKSNFKPKSVFGAMETSLHILNI